MNKSFENVATSKHVGTVLQSSKTVCIKKLGTHYIHTLLATTWSQIFRFPVWCVRIQIKIY